MSCVIGISRRCILYTLSAISRLTIFREKEDAMRSALRTFTSALGVCATCYLLSTASWHQVLLLFMVASFGWCWFVFSSNLENDRRESAPRVLPGLDAFTSGASPVVQEQVLPKLARQSSARPTAAVRPQPAPAPRVQKVYRFPIHELARPTLIAEFD